MITCDYFLVSFALEIQFSKVMKVLEEGSVFPYVLLYFNQWWNLGEFLAFRARKWINCKAERQSRNHKRRRLHLSFLMVLRMCQVRMQLHNTNCTVQRFIFNVYIIYSFIHFTCSQGKLKADQQIEKKSTWEDILSSKNKNKQPNKKTNNRCSNNRNIGRSNKQQKQTANWVIRQQFRGYPREITLLKK